MLKKYLIIAITVFTLVFCASCGSDSETGDSEAATEKVTEATEAQNEFGATVTNAGGDFDVSIKEITDDGIVLVCKNTDDADAITATVNYVEMLDQTYDPTQADDGGALKMRDLATPDTNVAWIDISPKSKCEIKIICDDCKSADDYKNLVINYDESIWDSTDSAPETYKYESLSIEVKAQ